VTPESAIPDALRAIALLDDPNRRSLYEFVVGRHGPVGRDEAAGATGMSRELAAFHLDRLVAAGLLSTEYRRLGGRRGPGAGRPAKLYRRAERDLAVSYPQREYGRAAALFAEALERLDRGPFSRRRAASIALSDVAHARGRSEGVAARRRAGPRPGRRQLRTALLDLLQRDGYAPEVAPKSDGICLRSCPYDALVPDHRDLTCGMNVAWAEGVLNGLGRTGLEARLDPIDGYCCVRLESKAATPAS
jgi:predicted ArsR family transcriptional regulator